MNRLIIVGVLLFATAGNAMTPAEFRTHADTVIQNFASFDPVWGTGIGIHDFDGRLADYSPRNIDNYTGYLLNEEKFLTSLDTYGWPTDDNIDHQLLLSNVKFQLFQLTTFPYWRKSPSIYADQCLYGIYYLVLRDYAPDSIKLPSIVSRLQAIPEICKTAQENLDIDAVPIFIETATEAIDQGVNLIKDVSGYYIAKFPDSRDEIEKARNAAVEALKKFNLYCTDLRKRAHGDFAIGKTDLEFLLHDINFLQMDSDSLLHLANNIYSQVDSEITAFQSKPADPDTLARFPIPSLTSNDILAYDQWEINKVKEFVVASGIATLPDSFGQCIPYQTPPFLRGIIRGIAYEPPAPLDKVQTGYFYIRPLPESLTVDQKATYSNFICKRGFRGSVVHEAYPGHHMQLLLADRHPSKVRKIQQNLIFVEGWALYCEEMAYHQGLFPDNPDQWLGILGGIRFRAVRIMVDIGLETGRFTPKTALDFMNEKLGQNDYYYTAEIRRYCAYPTQALSYLTGKTLIMQMRENARREDGDKFDLKSFHDKLLSEGSISPTLIAQKYGW